MGILVLAVGLGLWARGHTVPEIQPCMAGTCAFASLVSAAACFQRSREVPGEKRGWLALAWALVLSVWANVAMALLPNHPSIQGALAMGPSLAGLALIAAALLIWPWQTQNPFMRTLHILGSAIFVGSLLLLLWTLGTWGAGFRSNQSANMALIMAAARLSVLAGIGLYLLGENPRRIRGVLGFMLANVLAGVIYTALLQVLVERAANGVLPFVSIPALAPFILGLAAWSRAPLEVHASATSKARVRNWELLPYAPFLLAGMAILAEQFRFHRPATISVTGLLALTSLLVLRQYLLLRELRRTNANLEEGVKDRTRDLEAMQSALLRTERMNTVASLGAGISHDLNNLLGVVMASADVIDEDRSQGRLPRSTDIARITGASRKASSLTQRLMGLGRKENQPTQTVFLEEELANLEDMLRLLLPKAVSLHLELAPGPIPVQTRRSHLEQIVINLVSNARDAMPAGGQVSLRVDTLLTGSDPMARIQVIDNGPGLPREVMDHLFEPFFTTKAEGKGTGLGLHSVKIFVEGDGGRIAVENAPGKGCTFNIIYPLATLPGTGFNGCEPGKAW